MLWWLSPGDPERRTGGFIYNARIIDAMRTLGHEVIILRLDADWPFPEQLSCRAALASIPDGETVVADGLMWTGLSDADRRTLTARCQVWVVVHSPLDMEGGGKEVAVMERDALRLAHGWWATSRPTAALMADRLGTRDAHCICPGTEIAQHSAPRPSDRLLAVAHLIPRKGHDRLLDALALVKDLNWQISLVGSAEIDPQWADGLRVRAASHGISARLKWLGILDADALEETMAESSLLLHSARYEAYGMVLTEALASGLPVMSTEAGALDGVSSGAVMRWSQADEPTAWAEMLRNWLTDASLRRDASLAASELRWPSWREQAHALARLLAMPEA